MPAPVLQHVCRIGCRSHAAPLLLIKLAMFFPGARGRFNLRPRRLELCTKLWTSVIIDGAGVERQLIRVVNAAHYLIDDARHRVAFFFITVSTVSAKGKG